MHKDSVSSKAYKEYRRINEKKKYLLITSDKVTWDPETVAGSGVTVRPSINNLLNLQLHGS